MKKNKGNKVRSGIFITAAILLLMVGLYYVSKKQQLFSTTFSIWAVFGNVGGLQIGNNVRLSGITIGVVGDIEITSDSTVRVDMVIDENSRKFIRKDARAIIGSDGLIGNVILTILPGTPDKPVVADNDHLATTKAVSFDEILVKLKTTGDNAADVSDNLAALMTNIKEGKGTIGKIFMDPVFADNIDKAVINLKHGAGGFSNNMEAAKHSFLLRNFFKKKDHKGETGKDNKKGGYHKDVMEPKKDRKEIRQERREKRKERRETKKELAAN